MTLRIALLVALAAALTLVVVVPAGAGGPDRSGVLTVLGQLLDDDAGTPGDPSDDFTRMTGTLLGKRLVTSEDFRYDPLTGAIIAWGTERFDGCIDRNSNHACGPTETAGTLDLAFVYWGELDPATFALRSAQCVHPITGGTGGFAGAQGTITMKDTPRRDGSVLTTYVGKIKLGSVVVARKGAANARAMTSAAPPGVSHAGC